MADGQRVEFGVAEQAAAVALRAAQRLVDHSGRAVPADGRVPLRQCPLDAHAALPSFAADPG
jgi:hypothetical protein